MPNFDISEKGDHILVTTRGKIGNADVKDIHRIATQKATVSGISSILIDNRKLSKIPDELQRAIEISRSVYKSCESYMSLKFAVVSNKDNFGAAAFCGPVFSNDCKKFKAFLSMDEAKEWLGI